MTQRLRPDDMTFLVTESASTPMHNATLEIFEPRDDFEYDQLLSLIADRIAFVPRYRQKIRSVPGRLANPVWVDDEDFDVTYHVRRSALPRPGTRAQLKELVARLQSRPLDRDRPLWEIYLVEGLQGGQVGIITKTHHAMVDGISAVDIATVILDVEPTPREVPEDDWQPHREPGLVQLMAGAVLDVATRPSAALDSARAAVTDVRATAARVASVTG